MERANCQLKELGRFTVCGATFNWFYLFTQVDSSWLGAMSHACPNTHIIDYYTLPAQPQPWLECSSELQPFVELFR